MLGKKEVDKPVEKTVQEGVKEIVVEVQRKRTLLDAFGEDFEWKGAYRCSVAPGWHCREKDNSYACGSVDIRFIDLDKLSIDSLRRRYLPELLDALKQARKKSNADFKKQADSLTDKMNRLKGIQEKVSK